MGAVFIDGQAGTTGLELTARLADRGDIELIEIDSSTRKDPAVRRGAYEAADVVVLCLPDDAAREAVSIAPGTRLLDASSAHRVHPDWVFGLPELTPTSRQQIANAQRVSNPGCYATGFIMLIRPLIDAGLLSSAIPLRVMGLSGYSGGGRQMIESYESAAEHQACRPYALHLEHKHVPEMTRYSGTTTPPLFVPQVDHYLKGMIVTVALFSRELTTQDGAADRVQESLQKAYAGEPFVNVHPVNPMGETDNGYLSPTALNDTNCIDLMVFANADKVLLTARFDNLGKGAAGAAVQNLNLMLGVPETTGFERDLQDSANG